MKKEVFKVIKWLTPDYEIGDCGTVYSLKNGERAPRKYPERSRKNSMRGWTGWLKTG